MGRDYNTMYQESLVNPGGKDYRTIEQEAIRDQGYWGVKPAPATPAPSYSAPTPDKKSMPNAPSLDLPMLELSEDTSVVNQLNKLSSKDSLLRQQARVNAHESGVASGAIHGSQQAGASERAVLDTMMPLASSEASRAAGLEIGNWQQESQERLQVYEKTYAERIAKMGFDNALQIAHLGANNALTVAMLASTTSLLNNTDLDLQQGAWDKLRGVVNEGFEFNMNTLGSFYY